MQITHTNIEVNIRRMVNRTQREKNLKSNKQTLHCTACTALYYTALQSITLHYTTLHCITLHNTALHLPLASAEEVVRGTRSLSVKATKGWYHTFNRPSASPKKQKEGQFGSTCYSVKIIINKNKCKNKNNLNIDMSAGKVKKIKSSHINKCMYK